MSYGRIGSCRIANLVQKFWRNRANWKGNASHYFVVYHWILPPKPPQETLSSSLATFATNAIASGLAKVKGAYWPASSRGISSADSLKTSLYTHLWYGFAEVNAATFQMEPDASGEIEQFSTTVKRTNPNIQTLISIALTDSVFISMMGKNNSLMTFINSTLVGARNYGFDGLDLDFEFPSSSKDMDSLSILFTEWRKGIAAEAKTSGRPPLLLTAAVYYASTLHYIGSGNYPVDSLTQNLDWVNIMCYDYHGAWNPNTTGSNANLYDSTSDLSSDYGISSWLSAGLPPQKAVMGLPMYGRSWILKNQSEQSGIGASAISAGPSQPSSKAPGIFYYFEVTNFIQTQQATVVDDNTTVAAYCYANNTWISYDDHYTIRTKVLYSKSRQLLGYFFWAISFDSNWSLSSTASLTLDYAGVESTSPPAQGPSSGTVTSSADFGVALVFLVGLLILKMW